jgi:hypothetical protein
MCELGADSSGVNPSLAAGEPQFVASTNATAWEFPLDSVSIGNDTLPVNGTATLDMYDGASELSYEAASWLVDRIPGAKLETTTLYDKDGVPGNSSAINLPCDSNVTITLRMGGADVAIPPAQLFTPQGWVGGWGCYARNVHPPAAEGNSTTLDLELGLVFLQSVYTVFRFGETPAVGFVPLSDAAKGLKPAAGAVVSIPGHSGTMAPGPQERPKSGALAPRANALVAVAAAACFFYHQMS